MGSKSNKELIAEYKEANDIKEELHTFKKWEELGFKVKKNAKSIHKISIACPVENSDSSSRYPKMVRMNKAFFLRSQVEKVTQNKKYRITFYSDIEIETDVDPHDYVRNNLRELAPEIVRKIDGENFIVKVA